MKKNLKLRILFVLIGLSLIQFSLTVSKAQSLDTNYGGSRHFTIAKNDYVTRGLSFDSDPNYDNGRGDNAQPPADSYMLTNLIPGKQYAIRIEYMDGSIAAQLTIFNRETGKQSLQTRSYDETITARGSTHGPVDVFLLHGLTSYIIGHVNVVYKITVLPIDPAESDGTFLSSPNFELTDGTPFKAPSNPTVYVLENGRKRAFPSIYHFDSWYFGNRSNIIPVSTHVVNSYLTAPFMPFKEGTLLAYSDRPSDKTVFLISGGARRGFTSWNTFLALGYKPFNIMRVPGSVLDTVARGLNFVPKIVAGSEDATLAFIADTTTAYTSSAPSINESVSIKTTIVTKIGAANDALLDVEVYNTGGQRVFQKVFEHEYFTTTVDALNYMSNWTPTVAGQYKVKFGIFSGDWTRNYLWNDDAATITVGAGTSPTPTPTPTPTQSGTLSFTASASIQSSSTIAGQPVSIALSATDTSSLSATAVHVDLEIYNSAGQRAFQQVYDNLNFNPSQQISLSPANWTPAVAGQYTMKIGIFSSDWTMNHYWLDNAGTINVGAGTATSPPSAALSMIGGNSSGGNNQTLVYLVPVGGSIGFSFNAAASSAGSGSITAYEWRISNSVVSQAQNFSYTLGHGTHNITLAVTNSNGLTGTASARIIINEVPRVNSISPTSPISGNSDQNIIINGSGFQAYPTVDVIFPNGGTATLSGTQILNVTENSLTMCATLGSPGNWQIRVRNGDGGLSGWFNFTVR